MFKLVLGCLALLVSIFYAFLLIFTLKKRSDCYTVANKGECFW